MSADDDAGATERRREVARWLAVGDEDIRVARVCLASEEPALGAAAYHCQQAAEKVIKGILIAAGRAFRRTHDIDELADLAQSAYPHLGPLLDRCRSFSVWGTAYRYPAIEDVPEPLPSIADLHAALQDLGALRAASKTLADRA